MRSSNASDSGSDDDSVPPLHHDDDSSDESSTSSDSEDEFSINDDSSAFDISCEGEEVWSTINSVNVLPAIAVTSNEIFELTDDDHRDVSNNCCVSHPVVRGTR